MSVSCKKELVVKLRRAIPAYHATEETSNTSLYAAIVSCNDTSVRIKTLSISERIQFDEITESEEGRERVAKLDNAECGNDTNKSEEIWNRSSDDEGDGPVDGNNTGPDYFPIPGGEWWEV